MCEDIGDISPTRFGKWDFKGHFAMDSGRCHPLTVLDDHSRFSIVLHALDCERREPVQQVLLAAFERYGLPERINADNGPPWSAPTPGALTEAAEGKPWAAFELYAALRCGSEISLSASSV